MLPLPNCPDLSIPTMVDGYLGLVKGSTALTANAQQDWRHMANFNVEPSDFNNLLHSNYAGWWAASTALKALEAANTPQSTGVFGMPPQNGNQRRISRDNFSGSKEDFHNITSYRNGFRLNGGPFRALDDPKNIAFMKSLNCGSTPIELKLPGTIVHASHHRNDFDYIEEPVCRPVPFPGIGKRKTTEVSLSKAKRIAPSPRLSVHIRLVNGQRLIGHFNHHQTVTDIRSFIEASTTDGTTVYELETGIPARQLKNLDQTIEEAGLADSVIFQTLV